MIRARRTKRTRPQKSSFPVVSPKFSHGVLKNNPFKKPMTFLVIEYSKKAGEGSQPFPKLGARKTHFHKKRHERLQPERRTYASGGKTCLFITAVIIKTYIEYLTLQYPQSRLTFARFFRHEPGASEDPAHWSLRAVNRFTRLLQRKQVTQRGPERRAGMPRLKASGVLNSTPMSFISPSALTACWNRLPPI